MRSTTAGCLLLGAFLVVGEAGAQQAQLPDAMPSDIPYGPCRSSRRL